VIGEVEEGSTQGHDHVIQYYYYYYYYYDYYYYLSPYRDLLSFIPLRQIEHYIRTMALHSQ